MDAYGLKAGMAAQCGPGGPPHNTADMALGRGWGRADQGSSWGGAGGEIAELKLGRRSHGAGSQPRISRSDQRADRGGG